MTKDNFQQHIHRHFIAWFIALFIFAFFEWRHTGFVSYVFPFPLLIFLPALFILAEYGQSRYRKK